MSLTTQDFDTSEKKFPYTAKEIPKKILLVEDDQDILETVEELLRKSGYTVISATNGQEALDKLHQNAAPDLILLDLMMPVKDGFQFRSEQLQIEKFCKIPVVIMSADGSVEEKRQRTQANGYIKKPFNIDTMLNTLERILK